ncbi:AraC family transcriptional regulator [Maritimibacter sp. 55A14]|uniref:helix-turn-helix domain-containing protein n=1 Tax=Maritimibacter sp. 55A14 TaxID=2174844 RepID=UPI000D619530|nr:AraC family transcriptional regulator [Maritimibacter sp. 55A14]PWE33314.1 AraC family transcriptional regulator [Maritimibacter sp. 55A14]
MKAVHAPDSPDLLDRLEIVADPFALCELRGACSLGLGRDGGATVHYVLSGSGRFLFGRGESLPIRAGSLVLVPAGLAHSLRNTGDTGPARPPACAPAELRLAHHIAGAGAAGPDRMVAICAHATVSLRGTYGIVDLLRAPIHSNADEAPGLAAGVEALLAELADPAPGSRAMIRALLLQCVIRLFRARLRAGDPVMRWMPLLADSRLRPALDALLADPGAPHGIESLAARAGMSRSSFAARFAALHGTGPMEFLRALRLARAASLLIAGSEPVDRVAQRVGFASRSAFTRAFTAHHGVSPAAMRRAAGGVGS